MSIKLVKIQFAKCWCPLRVTDNTLEWTPFTPKWPNKIFYGRKSFLSFLFSSAVSFQSGLLVISSLCHCFFFLIYLLFISSCSQSFRVGLVIIMDTLECATESHNAMTFWKIENKERKVVKEIKKHFDSFAISLWTLLIFFLYFCATSSLCKTVNK